LKDQRLSEKSDAQWTRVRARGGPAGPEDPSQPKGRSKGRENPGRKADKSKGPKKSPLKGRPLNPQKDAGAPEKKPCNPRDQGLRKEKLKKLISRGSWKEEQRPRENKGLRTSWREQGAGARRGKEGAPEDKGERFLKEPRNSFSRAKDRNPPANFPGRWFFLQTSMLFSCRELTIEDRARPEIREI
jgi:hypothetical protein